MKLEDLVVDGLKTQSFSKPEKDWPAYTAGVNIACNNPGVRTDVTVIAIIIKLLTSQIRGDFRLQTLFELNQKRKEL